MGRYADNLKRAEANAELDKVLNTDDNDGKIESLKEVLDLLTGITDGNTKLTDYINTAIDTKITAAVGSGGAVANAIDAKITAAVAADGAVDAAIDAKITAGIGTDGVIETWGDGRYTLQNP